MHFSRLSSGVHVICFMCLRIEYLVFSAHQPVHTLACLAYGSQTFQPSCVKDFSWFPMSQHQRHYANSLDDRKSSIRNLIPCFVYWMSRVRILEAISTILTTETSKHPSISNVETVYVRKIVANRWRHWVGVSAVSASTHVYLFIFLLYITEGFSLRILESYTISCLTLFSMYHILVTTSSKCS